MSQPLVPAARSAGGHRFYWTVLAFALANVAVWLVLITHRSSPAGLPPLRVERFAPGDAATVGPRPNLSWTFSADVMPGQSGSGVSGAGAITEPPGAITPHVAGKWSWADARTLTFTPDANLPKATRFTLSLRPDRLAPAAGVVAAPMAQPFVATIRTKPLEVLGVRHIGRMDGQPVLEMSFSDNVLPADAMKHVTATGRDGKPRRLQLHGAPQGKLLRFRCQAEPDDAEANGVNLAIAVSAGLAGTAGPLGIEKPLSFRVEVAGQLMMTEAGVHTPPNGNPHIGLQFNGNADPETVRQVLSIEPAIPFTVTRPNESTLWVQGAFVPGTRYAVRIADAPAGGAAGAFPKPGTFSVFVPDRPASVWLEHEEGYLGSRGNRTLLAHAVNVPAVRVTVTRVYDSNLVEWRNAASRRRYGTDVTAYGRPIASKRIEVTAARNVKQELRLELDELLPPANRGDGVYRIALAIDAPADTGRATEDDGASEYGYSKYNRYGGPSAMVTLSDIGLSAKQGKDGSTSVWAVSLSTGKPMEDVRVRLFSSKSQLLATATTGADGLATLKGEGASDKLPAGEQPAVLIADLSPSSGIPGEDREGGSSRLRFRQPGALVQSSPLPNPPPEYRGRETTQLTWLDLRSSETTFADSDVAGKDYLRTGYEAFVYADRGVYRPGETVHLRAIVRGPGQVAPTSSFPLKWQFRRPDQRNWKSQVTSLDSDGAAGITLVLPSDLPTGRWTAQVGLAGEWKNAQAVLGSLSFQIEEYLPERIKAKVDVTAASGQQTARLSLADRTIKATLQADYLFGRPAARLPVTLVATLDPARFTPTQWKGWTFGDAAGFAEATNRPQPLRRRFEPPQALTDDKGQAAWPMDLLALHREDLGSADNGALAKSDEYTGPWELTVTSAVREEGGRAVGATHAIMVDGAPHYIGVRPRETSPRAGVATAFTVALVRPSGDVAQVDATVKASHYREEWNTVLLHEQGRYRYQSTRKLEPAGDAQVVQFRGGRGEIELTPVRGGRYTLVLRDEKAKTETAIGFFAVEPAWQENISRENPEKIDLVLLPAVKEDPVAELLQALGGMGNGTPLPVRGRSGEPSRILDESAARLAAPTSTGKRVRLPMAPSTQALRAVAKASKDLFRAMAEAANPPDRTSAASLRYHVGDRARVLVRSPFAGQLLLCVETDGVVSRRVIDMPASQMIVPIDVTDACRPNAYVTATVIRAVDPEAKWRAHRAFGAVRLPLDPADRRLNVAIDAPADMQPETTLSAAVRVTDETGKPVAGAAVTVAAVDEGILQLTNFKTPEPLAFFLSPRALSVRSADLYAMLMPEVAKPKPVGGDNDGPAGMVFGNGGNRRQTPISARRVRPVALFTGVLHTDAAGVARAELPVPAFAGKLRLMAIAYTGPAAGPVSQFGSADASTAVRSPMLVQSSWPRFAAPGDRFIVPLVLFNNTPAAGTAKVRLTIDANVSPLRFAGRDGAAAVTSIELPPIALAANGQASTRIEVIAAGGAGVAKIRLVAEMNGQTFGESLELPVRPPTPWTTDGGYLTASPGEPAKVTPPDAILPGTRELQLRVTPWPSLSLPRGLQYLDRYPYGCAEQTLSSAFPLIALGDIGERLAPGMFDRQRIADKVQAGVLRLMSMQTADGGLAMWPGAHESWPWASIYGTHFLLEARAAGHAIPEDFLNRLLGYCRTKLEEGGDESALIETQAYASYVLSLAGKPPRATMSRLAELLTKPSAAAGGDGPTTHYQPASARWHLAMAWLAAGRRDLAGGLVPSVLPKVRDGRQLGGNVRSPLRDRALLLTALLAVDPKRAEVAVLAQEISQTMAQEKYLGTHESAVALCALGQYLRVAATAPKYETAELWAGGEKLASAADGGSLIWDLPAGKSLPKDLEVRVAGKPDAQAFVAWLQVGVPLQPPPAEDAGMKVRRRYLDPAGNPINLAQLNSGDLVQVELSVTSAVPLENVVIEDLLPAGLEIENPRLRSGAAFTAATAQTGAAIKPPEPPNVLRVQHTDFRDDRVVVMANVTSGGTGSVTFLVRAVSPGVYVMPPVRAECMYDGGIRSTWGGGEKMKVQSPDAARLAGAKAE